MNEPIKTIAIKTAKLKPIRCKGKIVPYLDLDKASKETICRGTVFGLMAGQVLFLNRAGLMGLDVSGERLMGDGKRSKRTMKDVAKELTVEFEIDGKSHSLGGTAIGGRSLTIYCANCGSARKIVGVNIIVDAEALELDTGRFN